MEGARSQSQPVIGAHCIQTGILLHRHKQDGPVVWGQTLVLVFPNLKCRTRTDTPNCLFFSAENNCNAFKVFKT